MNENTIEVRYKPGEELVITLRNPFGGGAPTGETRERLRGAQVEVLKAARTAIDVLIEMMGDKSGESGRPRRRVTVE